jgi:hypothetical protein
MLSRSCEDLRKATLKSVAQDVHASSLGFGKPDSVSSAQSLQEGFVNEDGETNDQYHVLLRRYLTDIGENPQHAPLLSAVLSFISITDNVATRGMDAATKSNKLKKIIIQMINHSLSQGIFAVIFDDAQVCRKCSEFIIYQVVNASNVVDGSCVSRHTSNSIKKVSATIYRYLFTADR